MITVQTSKTEKTEQTYTYQEAKKLRGLFYWSKEHSQYLYFDSRSGIDFFIDTERGYIERVYESTWLSKGSEFIKSQETITLTIKN